MLACFGVLLLLLLLQSRDRFRVRSLGLVGVSWRRKQKRCHDNVPMIRQLVEMPVQERNVRCAESARGTGSDPGYRVSHESMTRKRVTKRTLCEHGQTRASHTTHHKHLSTGVVPAVIPSKGAFSEQFEFVEEVVVLATAVDKCL